VLVVDDDAPLRQIIHRWLSHNGYAVIEAADGISALHILLARTQQVDLVLTDIEMPLLGGRELAAIMRITRLETPVVLMTGSPDPPEGPPPAEGGRPLELLAKPFTPEQVIGALRRAVGPG
jgi:CheY-like chemotaxis protein